MRVLMDIGRFVLSQMRLQCMEMGAKDLIAPVAQRLLGIAVAIRVEILKTATLIMD